MIACPRNREMLRVSADGDSDPRRISTSPLSRCSSTRLFRRKQTPHAGKSKGLLCVEVLGRRSTDRLQLREVGAWLADSVLR